MASCNLCGVEMVGGCAANGCPHRATQPSVPSGEAVACVKRLAYWANLWAEQGSDETLTRDIVDGDERVALASLYAAPPQERVSEAMVEAGLKAKDGYAVFGAVYGVSEREVMRRILTAALAPSRTTEDK
jgi:hypothetical protein